MDPRQAAITTGQAYNIATQLITADPEYAGPSDAVLGNLAVIAGQVFDIIIGAQEEAEAVTRVGNAFPGTEQVQQPAAQPANVVPFPQQVAQPAPAYQQPAQAVAPAPIPGAQDGDPQTAALWQEFFQDPSKFWDNRNRKTNPKAPDFKHKDRGDGLWVIGKKNPSWVPAQLAARGLA